MVVDEHSGSRKCIVSRSIKKLRLMMMVMVLAGPIVASSCHAASDPDIRHQQFQWNATTELLYTGLGSCITVVPDWQRDTGIDVTAMWARLKRALPATAFVVPVSPRGCVAVDDCIGMVDDPHASCGDCVCISG